MKSRTRSRCRKSLDFEACEERLLTALVFVLNGNTFAATGPNALTANAAAVLRGAGEHVIELSTPTLATPAAFDRVVRQIAAVSHGQPIGLVGFSSGGVLAARLAGVASLNVSAVLDYYGEPDLTLYLASHNNDTFARYVKSHVAFTQAGINQFSGPSPATSYVVCAFGLYDRNVVASFNTATFPRDFHNGAVYVYAGGHGAPISASPPALADFLRHL